MIRPRNLAPQEEGADEEESAEESRDEPTAPATDPAEVIAGLRRVIAYAEDEIERLLGKPSEYELIRIWRVGDGRGGFQIVYGPDDSVPPNDAASDPIFAAIEAHRVAMAELTGARAALDAAEARPI